MADRVIVSPHLDDAVLSAWRLIGPGTLVVTCCTASPSRRAEDEAVLGALGAAWAHLGLDDAPPGQARPELVAPLAAQLAPHLEGAAEVWAPLGIGRHPDHHLARKATVAAVPGGVRWYGDLPYAARRGWPMWVDGRRTIPRPRGPEALWWDARLRTRHRLVEHLVTLDADERAAKLDAIRGYTSQAEPLGYCGPRADELVRHEAWWERR